MFWNSIKEIEAPDLARWMDQGHQNFGKFRVIDVRQPQEIAAGTVPGAEAVPLHTLPLRVNDLKRDETLVFVCRSGARSAQACMFLKQHGFENVVNLRGGMMAWAQTGQAIGQPQLN
jgi:rhodanese-related sulfurtransferase